LLLDLSKIGWLEFGIHGFVHSPDQEMVGLKAEEILKRYADMDLTLYEPFFRPPGWTLPDETIKACNELSWWVAPHNRDAERAELCEWGAYLPGEQYDCWHGHTHDVCGNFIDKRLPELLAKWPSSQTFLFASEGVKVYAKTKVETMDGVAWLIFLGKDINLRIRPDSIDERVAKEIVARDIYRVERIQKEDPDIKTVIDVGAHLGAFTVLASHLWPNAKILAYEPWPENFYLLHQNTIDRKNVSPFQDALVGETTGVVRFKDPKPGPQGNTGGGRVVEEGGDRSLAAYSVERLLTELGSRQIDLLKLDCEGSEFSILEALLKRGELGRVKWIRGEWHSGDAGEKRVRDLLAKTHEVHYRKVYETTGLFYGRRLD